MSRFRVHLAGLPSYDSVVAVRLTGPDDEQAVIENRPGTLGSLCIYAWLLEQHGRIDRRAAKQGLQLYAEHGEEARANPGKHPNIDRLLAIVADGRPWQGRIET